MTMLIFFSSRRRHTRWPRDWSSDVCSSDLDRLDDESREALLYQEDGVAVSATDRESLHVLLEAIDQFLVAMGRVDAIGPPQYPVHDDTAVTAEEDDAHFVTPDEDTAERST